VARKRLLWQFFPYYLIISLFALLAVVLYASQSLKDVYQREVSGDLAIQAWVVGSQFRGSELLSQRAEIMSTCRELRASLSTLKTPTRFSVIDLDGRVIGDSRVELDLLDPQSNQREFIEALNLEPARAKQADPWGKDTRFCYFASKEMVFIAVAIKSGEGADIGVVRAAVPLDSINAALSDVYVKIVVGGMIIAVLAAILSLVVSRRISRPLEQMKKGAERLAKGDLTYRFAVPDTLEFGSLAKAMNQMATRLYERIHTVVKQRNEQEAVLASMVEGVLAVDGDERLINMNKAASRLIGVVPSELKGRSIQEIVRNSELQRFVTRALNSEIPVEGELILGLERDRFVQAHGTILRGADGTRFGALVVFNDITRLRKLENVRREFVANVSHELKTPITSIKGYVETLLEDTNPDPADTKRFLAIIAKHADRLNAIIDDLLSLSRIEQEEEKQSIALEDCSVTDVLQGAIRVCETNAVAREITIELSCPDDLTARMNAPLLEQAVINLVDNATKYSNPGSQVRVTAEREGSVVVIGVRDHGRGIAKEHLPRIFERFYRVDKARSRKLGGTGLGLAITKHIIQSHGGQISVSSEPGWGSLFTVQLPAY